MAVLPPVPPSAPHDPLTRLPVQTEPINRSDPAAPADAGAKAKKAKQKVEDVKSEWFPALQAALVNHPGAKVVCKYDSDDKGVKTNLYYHDDEWRFRFKVTWEIVDATDPKKVLASSKPAASTTNDPSTPIRQIAGFDAGKDTYIYTQIPVPKEGEGPLAALTSSATPNDIRNAQMFAYQSAASYETLMLTALGQRNPDLAKINEAITYLTAKNFVSLGLYDAKGESLSLIDAGENKLIEWAKVKRVSMLLGKDIVPMDLPPDLDSGLRISERVFRQKFSTDLSEADAYDKLSDALKKHYDHGNYDSHVMSLGETKATMAEAIRLSKEIRDEQIKIDRLQSEIKNTVPPLSANAKRARQDLIRTSEGIIANKQEQLKRCANDYKLVLQRELMNAKSPAGVDFATLGPEETRLYAYHVQQQLMNLSRRYEAYCQFFTGDNPVKGFEQKYDRKLDDKDIAIVNPDPGVFQKIKKSLINAFSDAPPFFPGFHIGPIPVPIQFGWMVKGVGALVPEWLKLRIKTQMTPETPALDRAKSILNAAPGAGEVPQVAPNPPPGPTALTSRQKLMVNFVEAYNEMEKMQLEMIRLKALMEAVAVNRESPGRASGNWDTIQDFFLLISPKEIDAVLGLMDKRNAFIRAGLNEQIAQHPRWLQMDAERRQYDLEHPAVQNTQPVAQPDPGAGAGNGGGGGGGQPPPAPPVPPNASLNPPAAPPPGPNPSASRPVGGIDFTIPPSGGAP